MSTIRSSVSRASYLTTRRMSRRRLVQAGAVGLSASVLANVPGGRQAVAQETGYGGEDVTLTYGMWDAAQRAGVDEQIALFNETFPKIKVEPQVVPFDDYWTKLQTGVAGGATNDVFWMNAPNLPVFASQGALLPIDPIIGEGGADPSVYPEALVASYTFDGTAYGIPRDFDTIALFYNTDLFDQAGVEYPTDEWTWENLRQAAEQLTTDGRWGFAATLSDQQTYFNFIKQNKGEILNEDLTKTLINEPPACEALDFLTEFFEAEFSPPVSVQQANEPYDTLFPAGQVAMIAGGSWHVGTYSEANPAIKVAPLPQGKQRATMVHGLANVIWAKSPNQGAALEWVKFLASKEAEQILGQSATVIPAMDGLQEDWVASVPDMDLQIFLDALEYSFPLPSPPSGPEWRDLFEETLIEGWSGNIPAEEICDRAAEAANAALAQE